MTVIHTACTSRRSRSTILKMRLYHLRSRLTIATRKKLAHKLIPKPKDNIGYVSAWINRWSIAHSIILLIYFLNYHGTFTKGDYGDGIKSLSLANNKTMIRYKYLDWGHYNWCSSSSSNFFNNSNIYAIMNQSVILPSVTCCVMFVTVVLVYFSLNENSDGLSTHSSQFYWREWLTLCMFIGLSVFNQWINLLTCRPVQILDDRKYTSMLILQIIGFIACLHYAYCLGKSIKLHFHQRKTSTLSNISTSDSRVSLFPSVNHIV